MATAAIEPLDPLDEERAPGFLCEVVNGRFVEEPMGVDEKLFAGLVFGMIDRYTRTHPVGRAHIEMSFDLRPHVPCERRPDVASLSNEGWARERRVPQARSWPVVPDLAVEIVSPTNSAVELASKLEEYVRSGVRQVRVVDPVHSKFYAYTSTTSVRILTPADGLDGGDVLPGFRAPLGELFEEAGQPD